MPDLGAPGICYYHDDESFVYDGYATRRVIVTRDGANHGSHKVEERSIYSVCGSACI